MRWPEKRNPRPAYDLFWLDGEGLTLETVARLLQLSNYDVEILPDRTGSGRHLLIHRERAICEIRWFPDVLALWISMRFTFREDCPLQDRAALAARLQASLSVPDIEQDGDSLLLLRKFPCEGCIKGYKLLFAVSGFCGLRDRVIALDTQCVLMQ